MWIITCSAVQTHGKKIDCPSMTFRTLLFLTFTWEIWYFIYLVSGVRFTISVTLAGLSCWCVRGSGFPFQKGHVSIFLLPTRRYILPARSSYTDCQKEFVSSSNNARLLTFYDLLNLAKQRGIQQIMQDSRRMYFDDHELPSDLYFLTKIRN